MSTTAPHSSNKSTAAAYKPVLPITAEWSTVLSQDVIATATIPVDSTSSSPVGVFTNPASGGQAGNAEVEALAIVNTGAGKQLCHIARDRTTHGGWRAIPLFSGRAADQVTAAVAYSGTPSSAVYGLFTDGAQLYSTTLGADGATWSPPVAVANGAMTNPRVAYSPDGRVVIYGANGKGDLVTAYQAQIGGPFTAVVCSVQGALGQGDFQLCLTDEQTFTILANINTRAYLITGVLGADHASSIGVAPQFTEKLQQVVLGYWSPVQQTLIFVLVDDDKALHVWSQNSVNSSTVAQKIPNSSVQQATGHVALDQSLHLYAIDGAMNLWVLHQSARRPWRDDGTPNFAPFIPLDKGVARVVSDMNPAAAPSLFALDAGDFSLRLHEQDEKSQLWTSDQVLQHSTQAYEVTRHRVEVRLTDAKGLPLPLQQLTVATEKGASAMDVWAQGKVYQVDDGGVTLTTDAMGKLTVAVLASNGLACPNLVVSSGGLASPVMVRPAGGLHDYLSGNGTLNPTNPGGALPMFDKDGKTLQAAKVHGSALAPGANNDNAGTVASAIRNGALVALNKTQGVAGFAGSLRKGAMKFEVFQSAQAMDAYSKALDLTQAGDFWDDLKHFFGDVFEGIANAVIKIAHFVVDVGRAIVNFTLEIAEWTANAVGLPIDGIEKAAKFMAGVFNSVDAFIDKVVDWLKALFDFRAIWRTKRAFQQALSELPDYLLKALTGAENAGEEWFGQQKESVDKYFTRLKEMYKGKGLGDQGGFQPPAGGPRTQPIAGGASPADFTQNVHHNWLMEKVSSHVDDKQFARFAAADEDDPFKGFKDHLWSFSEELRQACVNLGSALQTLFTDPAEFASLGVPKLIDALNDFVDALLDFLDAIFHLVLETAELAISELKKVLSEELPLGFINTIWGWIAKLAGYPEDAKLTLAAFISLIGAFPCTLLFKLIAGVEHEPFPDGRLPLPKARAGAVTSVDMPWQCHVTSDSLQILQFWPTFLADFLGNKAPKWVTAVGFGFSLIIWVLANGYPSAHQWRGGILALGGAVYIFVIIGSSTFLWKNRNDVANVLLSIYGFGRLALGAYQLAESNPTDPLGNKMALILLPLPPLFAFLNFDVIRNTPAAPFAIGANFFFDFVGYIGGGAAKLYDTVQTIPPLN
jgi:hypothetical protein